MFLFLVIPCLLVAVHPCVECIPIKKKSHTCEEVRAHLRISFWPLLINMKDKYLFKKLLKWANKKKKIFTMLNFLKKIKNDWLYHYMIYSSWYRDLNSLKLVILGHFLPFYHLKAKKSKYPKNEKVLKISFYKCVPKIAIIWCMVPEM